MSLATAAAAATALLVTVILFVNVLADLQQSRVHSATDSCRLIKAIAILATPPGKAAQAEAFINVTPLRDCASYGHNILSGKFALPPLPKLQP